MILELVLLPVAVFIITFFLLPALKGPREKLYALFKKKPFEEIKTQADKDARVLELTLEPLRKINGIPSYPDTHRRAIEWLGEIDRKAILLRSDEFADIKSRLLNYVAKADRLHANILLQQTIEILGRTTAIEFINEIQNRLTAFYKKKKKESLLLSTDKNIDKKILDK